MYYSELIFHFTSIENKLLLPLHLWLVDIYFSLAIDGLMLLFSLYSSGILNFRVLFWWISSLLLKFLFGFSFEQPLGTSWHVLIRN